MTRIPIHGRIHLGSDEKVAATQFVRCPEDRGWAPVEACRRCVKCEAVEEGEVRCASSRPVPSSRSPESAPITDVMDANVLCVEADATAASVRAAMVDHGAPIAIVVDGSGHAIGVCSRSDVADRSPSRRVERCMTPFVITMLDSTRVADALELVIERDLHHVPVLSGGRVVGLVTPQAVIRWLAQALREVRVPRVRRRVENR